MHSVIVDMNLLPYHSEKEFKSLILQIIQSYSICKRENIKFILFSSYINKYFNYILKLIENTNIYAIVGSPKFVLRLFSCLKSIVLDPYAEDKLSLNDLLYFDCIILGGIVDKTPIKGLTTKLRCMDFPKLISKRVELRGSIIGVPSTLNGLLNSLFLGLTKNNLELGIKEAQSKRDARLRALVEINKYKISNCKEIIDIYYKLKEWLNLDFNDLPKILSKSRYRECIKYL
jgi:Trm5-related predicted tRNA methylase